MRQKRSRHGQIQPVLLLVLDGFGLRKKKKANPIDKHTAPHLLHYFSEYPNLELDPTGEAVGLPRQHTGNSAVGHMTIGAGRIIEQDLVRINKSIKDRTYLKNKALLEAMKNAAQNGRALHLLGLCSDAGIHSHINHLFALLEMAKRNNVSHVFIHAITDGRDVKERSATKFLSQIEEKTKNIGVGEIATICGRHYAMDRTEHWDLEESAYNAIVSGQAPGFTSYEEAIKDAYKKGKRDATIPPCILSIEDHRTPRVIDGDSVIFFNFRNDRARQLTHGFTDLHFKKFKRDRLALQFVTFTKYDSSLDLKTAFERPPIKNSLSQVLSKAHIHHFHCAEQEKFDHITRSFSSDAKKDRFEHHLKLPSPLGVTPQMGSQAVTHEVLKALSSQLYGAVIVNYANFDIVGHTGDIDLARRAVDALDHQLSHIVSEAKLRGFVTLITSDHGNIEDLGAKFGTIHTLNNVPFIMIDPHEKLDFVHPDHAALCDIAPTMLDIMGLPIPKEMSGRSLLKKKEIRQ